MVDDEGSIFYFNNKTRDITQHVPKAFQVIIISFVTKLFWLILKRACYLISHTNLNLFRWRTTILMKRINLKQIFCLAVSLSMITKSKKNTIMRRRLVASAREEEHLRGSSGATKLGVGSVKVRVRLGCRLMIRSRRIAPHGTEWLCQGTVGCHTLVRAHVGKGSM